MKKPITLIIMDGFGESKNTNGNAIAASKTHLWAKTNHRRCQFRKQTFQMYS